MEMQQIEMNIKSSFEHVKNDIFSNKTDIDALKREVIELKNIISSGDQQSITNDIKGEITQVMNGFFGMNNVGNVRNQKSSVKEMVLSIIEDNPIRLPELKEEIVDIRKVCSKASFYRYVSELEREHKVMFSEGIIVPLAIKA